LTLADLVEDGGVGIEIVPGLINVGERHGGTYLNGSRIRLLLADHHLEKGGLARAVGSDDPHDATRGQQEGEILHQQSLVKTLYQLVRVHHHVTESWSGGNGDL
jgi:hypothetical protein